MKNIRKFETVADYEAWMSGDAVFPNVCYVAEDGRIAYNLPPVPLYIEAIENLTVTFGNTYEYSKDNSTWTSGTSSTSISANAGEKVYFRTSGLTADSSNGIGKFTISDGNCNVGGNIMSMVYGADFEGKTEITQKYQFYQLFYQATQIVDTSRLVLPATTLASYCYGNMFDSCTSLVNAPALPATTLASGCYSYMFRNCSSLVNAPTLPATTLEVKCYSSMFYNCSSLVNAPALPATTLEVDCYSYMFYGCTSLVNAPALPATTLAGGCYSSMFYNCSSLVNAPALPATTLIVNCYSSMFYKCSNLVNAPALPATTLASGCYKEMFRNCSSLNYIKAMFTITPSSTYMKNWVSNVASNGTFVKNSAATWADTFDASAIPSGWTVETASA